MSRTLRVGSRRLAAMTGLSAILVLVAALPAAAHPSFASSAALGFLPNAQGGLGVGNVAPPYGPNTEYTVAFYLPDEVAATTSNGKDDNTVKASIQIPQGWTNPTCGDARARVNNESTSNTNQPAATPLAGWNCVVSSAAAQGVTGDRQFLTWTGPQSDTKEAGAQFFGFKVTTPSPTTLTRYGGLTGSGFSTGEGFVSTQTYASYDSGAGTGQLRNWYPPNNPLATSSSNTAGGLVRTVAPTAPPTGTPGSQTITAVVPGVPTGGGLFSISIPNNQPISLTAGTPVTAGASPHYPFTGTLNAITVSDTRPAGPGWALSGIASAFTNLESDSAKYLGWTPQIASAGAGAVAGAQVFGLLDATSGPGLQTTKPLATGTSDTGLGQASIRAALALKLPYGIAGNTYTSTLTITAI